MAGEHSVHTVNDECNDPFCELDHTGALRCISCAQPADTDAPEGCLAKAFHVGPEPTVETPGSEFMDPFEQQLADEIYEAMMRSSRESPRGKQGAAFILGVSDIGFCPERTRRMLDGQTPDPTDVLPAFLGTAIGDHVEKAWKAANPNLIIQAEVEVVFNITVDGEKWTIKVPGHPDVVDPDRVLMIDAKTDYLLADAEKQGPDQQKSFQRHLYGLGAWQAGLFPTGTNLEDVKVGNAWIDRSGQDRRVHVDVEPLDLDIVAEAERWLEDVVYHLVNKESAFKAPPRQMCEVVCGYFMDCRFRDISSDGLIEDPEALARVAQYAEGAEMEKAGKRIKEAAKVWLKDTGVTGVTPSGLQVVRTDVDAGYVEAFTRRGYTRLEVKPIPKPKKSK